jgi:aryl-alcohol dehydrogenase-like predicted oxidoreductase
VRFRWARGSRFGGQLGEEAAEELIHAAYDQGINFFDNADMYANGMAEELMGRAIRDLPREALVLSSKVFWPTMPGPNGRGLSRKHVTESINASLRRLGPITWTCTSATAMTRIHPSKKWSGR